MNARHIILAFLGVFALTSSLIAMAEQPRFPREPAATADSMNGYFLKDYAGFWKDPDWHFVTVRFRKDTGEMRLTYANDLAWKALKAGGKEYPDGAVFGKVGLMTAEDPSFTSSAVPKGARRYQLMVRDAKKWKDTNGWGYALFDGTGKAIAEDQDIASQACYACHALVPERGEVFSEPFHMDISATLAPEMPQAEAISRIEFETVKAAALPARIREKLPKDFAEARLVQGKLALHLFRGTIDEIRPTLVKEAVKSGRPAALVSKDGTLFSVVYIDKGAACKLSGGAKGAQVRGFYTTGTLPGKESDIALHEHCDEGK
jgi:hypothetical protein